MLTYKRKLILTNIAMAFYGEVSKRGLLWDDKNEVFTVSISKNLIHSIANEAASNFLNSFMTETKQ